MRRVVLTAALVTITALSVAPVSAQTTESMPARSGTSGLSGVSGYSRETHSATNFGGGLTYRVSRWLGASADYRMFVFNINEAPRVNRFTAGVSILLR